MRKRIPLASAVIEAIESHTRTLFIRLEGQLRRVSLRNHQPIHSHSPDGSRKQEEREGGVPFGSPFNVAPMTADVRLSPDSQSVCTFGHMYVSLYPDTSIRRPSRDLNT